MPWVTPKTNWVIQPRDQYGRYNGDWFNINPDYIRIKGNLEYLAQRIGFFFRIVTLVSVPTLTTQDLVYANHLNNIEQNIDILNESLPRPLFLPETKTWVENGSAPGVADLNRIEQCCLQIKNAIEEQSIFVWKLPFHMSGRRF